MNNTLKHIKTLLVLFLFSTLIVTQFGCTTETPPDDKKDDPVVIEELLMALDSKEQILCLRHFLLAVVQKAFGYM